MNDWNAKRVGEQRARLLRLHTLAPYQVRVHTPLPLPREAVRVFSEARLSGQSLVRVIARRVARRVYRRIVR